MEEEQKWENEDMATALLNQSIIADERLLPDHKLIAAVLARGYLDAWNPRALNGAPRSAPGIKLRARQWISETDTVEEPYTFEWCCDQLGFDIAKTRLRFLNVEAPSGMSFNICHTGKWNRKIK